ncbi:MFS transporter [Oceanirhabdus sp. W0125-5]|uniref:MFS transporter n=1 Tax=Oceanirhabdus sp. W0125-5 TaxID=2999116 RepID=UPI0022F33541|nr:MFS transporter [Oceanirhabdus sp. W0125-5]WBW99147.1 MFS transporter [Oceanirhabdus sp. W0125-5]
MKKKNENSISLINIVRNYKDYSKLFTANLISRFGDSLDAIAYSYMVFALTGSKALLALVFLFNVLPNLLISSFAGAAVDFFSKKKIIVLGDILRGSVVTLTAILFMRDSLEVWQILMFTFLNSVIESFVSPCKFATIPRLIDEKYYLVVNSSLQSVVKFVELIGMGIAGIIIGTLGIPFVMGVDAVTFFISAIIILTVTFPNEEKKSFTVKNYFKSYSEGFKYIFNKKIIFTLVLSLSLFNFFLTPVSIFNAAYVDEILKMGPEGLSYLGIGFSVGNILGGILAGTFGKKLGYTMMMFLGLFFTGVFYTAYSIPGFTTIISPKLIAFSSFSLIGAAIPFASAALSTILMTVVPKEMLARIGSFLGMFTQSSLPLGSLVFGALILTTTLQTLILITGICLVIFSCIPTLIYSKFVKSQASISEVNVSESPAS